ncbi:hypothetical protein [Algoriphagus winogradskyi]|uniref:Uncharacterized protein n=1 Tax=Algoriphagus winogradskyi TaxID=237017 RepID=A0ABY1NXB0_9BACT|nr:hypothetical protein [Algoriphagus winogradskyi]SMP21116.1 hypothetical protein SAMN06265367_103237 [Algoriphagus winogradskyi]
MKRREFIHTTALTGIGLSLPFANLFAKGDPVTFHSEEYRDLVFSLLKDWCDGMIKVQIINPSDPKVHGLLDCPACETIHGRVSDAVYPFFYMAEATGEKKYLDAGIAVFEWSQNVSQPDGSWTNDVNPNSWNGTTVFGAIALAETLKYHGDLLEADRRQNWTDRLGEAAEFIYRKFPTIDATNVNYGATNSYAMNLIGNLLDEPKYIALSKKLAAEVKKYFTAPNSLLYGEIKPSAHKLSGKGLPGVDLGYNVEESLNSLVMYALHEKDEELLGILQKSLASHLEFMLPDGGFDNSWGTRMFKWTYWGSRTCDGCQPAFSLMAGYNPAFGTAAFKNTELLKRCTADGLLHGGPHYVSHGIKPCVHHTFAHAKSLAVILDHWDQMPTIDQSNPLPRATADGLRYFEELDTVLFSRGDWRGTVSAYDAQYYPKMDLRQATGNSLGMLYHTKVGLLCAASLAVYRLMEPLNQQDAPGKDIALTPRLETFQVGEWFTNLYDLPASFSTEDQNGEIRISGDVKLKNEAREILQGSASDFRITYICSGKGMQIKAETRQALKQQTSFTIPIISKNTEPVEQPEDHVIIITKPEGKVKIEANVPLTIIETEKGRTFNMVPGVEALPIRAELVSESVELTISVI